MERNGKPTEWPRGETSKPLKTSLTRAKEMLKAPYEHPCQVVLKEFGLSTRVKIDNGGRLHTKYILLPSADRKALAEKHGYAIADLNACNFCIFASMATDPEEFKRLRSYINNEDVYRTILTDVEENMSDRNLVILHKSLFQSLDAWEDDEKLSLAKRQEAKERREELRERGPKAELRAGVKQCLNFWYSGGKSSPLTDWIEGTFPKLAKDRRTALDQPAGKTHFAFNLNRGETEIIDAVITRIREAGWGESLRGHDEIAFPLNGDSGRIAIVENWMQGERDAFLDRAEANLKPQLEPILLSSQPKPSSTPEHEASISQPVNWLHSLHHRNRMQRELKVAKKELTGIQDREDRIRASRAILDSSPISCTMELSLIEIDDARRAEEDRIEVIENLRSRIGTLTHELEILDQLKLKTA